VIEPTRFNLHSRRCFISMLSGQLQSFELRRLLDCYTCECVRRVHPLCAPFQCGVWVVCQYSDALLRRAWCASAQKGVRRSRAILPPACRGFRGDFDLRALREDHLSEALTRRNRRAPGHDLSRRAGSRDRFRRACGDSLLHECTFVSRRNVSLRMWSRSPCSLMALTKTWMWGCGPSVCSAIEYRCLNANSSLHKFFTAASTFPGSVPGGIENRTL